MCRDSPSPGGRRLTEDEHSGVVVSMQKVKVFYSVYLLCQGLEVNCVAWKNVTIAREVTLITVVHRTAVCSSSFNEQELKIRVWVGNSGLSCFI